MKPTFTIHQVIRLTAYAVTEGADVMWSDRARDGTMVGGHMNPFVQALRSHLVLLIDMINRGDVNAHSRLTRVPVNKLGVAVGVHDQDAYELTFDGFSRYCAELGLDPHATSGVAVISAATPITEKSDIAAPSTKKAALQEAAILSAMSTLGIDALNYQDGPVGRPGQKDRLCKTVRKKDRQLFQSDNVFDKAWERLRKNGRIKFSPPPNTLHQKFGGGGKLSKG